MPEQIGQRRREAITRAIRRALRERRLSHKDVARILGVSEQTVSNAVSQANFSEDKAIRWSTALDIPIEVFTIGVEPLPVNDYDRIMHEISELRKQVEDLRLDVNNLLRRNADLEG